MEVPQRLISLEKKICQITVCSLESKCKGIRWTGAVQILWNPALRSPCVYGQSFIMVTLLSPKQKSSQSFSYSKKSFNMPRRHPDNRDLKQTTMATATRTLQNKGLISRTMLCMCVLMLCTFLSRPLQSNNVKWQSSEYFGERVFIWN